MMSLSDLNGFQWDSGNSEKNLIKHKIERAEAEQLFFNEPLFIIDDNKHSKIEKRYAAYGKTDAGRMLFCVFTIRVNLIRVISVRDMNKEERKQYERKEIEEETQENTKV